MPQYGSFLYGQDYYGYTGTIIKKFVYKVYDSGSYVTTWINDVISEPQFNAVINGSPGQLKVTLARGFDNYGEEVDVKLNNRVECYVYDRDVLTGKLLFVGYIASYTPQLTDGDKETIDITILPYASESERYMLREASGDTSVAFYSQDPSDIFRGVLSRLQLDGSSLGTGTIEDTNTTVTYIFNTNTGKEGFDKCVQLAPANWWWSIDPTSNLNFRQKPSTVTHDLSIGQHITQFSADKRSENIINRVFFTGGGDPPLYYMYERSGSISTYGLYSKKIVDQRVTVCDTAFVMASKILDEKESPEVRTRLRIMDNNGNFGQGYDIESINVGDTIRIKNLDYGSKSGSLWDVMVWDVDVWDYTLASVAGAPLLVVKISYHPDFMDVETSSRFPEVSKRIEDINRNLENSQTVNNPASPS